MWELEVDGWPGYTCRGECRPFKTNATEECLAYHTESMKQTNMCGNRPISLPDVRNSCCRPSASVVMIRYRAEGHNKTDVAEEDKIMEGWHQRIHSQSISSLLRMAVDKGRWTLLFPVLIPESISLHRSVIQFSFACFIFHPTSWFTSL